VAIPIAFTDPMAYQARFAEFVLSFAGLELELVMAALYIWLVESVVGAAARGLELVADYAATHEVPLHELPTFEKLELVGLLDFRENGDPRAYEENGDLVDMLSTSFGIELNSGDGSGGPVLGTAMGRAHQRRLRTRSAFPFGADTELGRSGICQEGFWTRGSVGHL
jgi:hypothetical protein